MICHTHADDAYLVSLLSSNGFVWPFGRVILNSECIMGWNLEHMSGSQRMRGRSAPGHGITTNPPSGTPVGAGSLSRLSCLCRLSRWQLPGTLILICESVETLTHSGARGRRGGVGWGGEWGKGLGCGGLKSNAHQAGIPLGCIQPRCSRWNRPHTHTHALADLVLCFPALNHE